VQNANGVLTTSVFDGANQLMIAETGAIVTTYTYDGSGNRNLENAGGVLTSYTWNEENKMVGFSLPTGEVQTLLYGGDGDLRRKTVALGGIPQSDVRLLKDGQVVLQESDVATGALLRHYTNGGGEWGNLISMAQGDNTGGHFNLSRFNLCTFNQTSGPPYALSRFFAFDHIGTTRLLLDANGNVVDTSLFSGFGVEMEASGSTENPFSFDGNWQYFQITPRHLLAGARIYDPFTGAWLSPDPIGFVGGDWNFFTYVENNPTNQVDPTGLASTPQPQPCPTPIDPCGLAKQAKKTACAIQSSCRDDNRGYKALLKTNNNQWCGLD
jgi:RHS repeat-associated protein